MSDTPCKPPHAATTLRVERDPFSLSDDDAPARTGALATAAVPPQSTTAEAATGPSHILSRPPLAAPSRALAPTRGFVAPKRPRQDGFDADLLGRVGNRRVKIRKDDGLIFAVDLWRLHAVDKAPGQPRRRLSNAELNALPWLGAGPDPLTHHEPDKFWRKRLQERSDEGAGGRKRFRRKRGPARSQGRHDAR